MIRPAQLLCRLGLVSALLALGAPAIGLAVEPTSTTPVPVPASEGTTSTSTPPPTTEQPPATTTSTPEPTAPQVQTQLSQGSSPGSPSHVSSSHAHSKSSTTAPGSAPEVSTSSGPRAKQKAVSPSALTPSLPLALQSSISGVPGFFIESFRIPPFLLPIYQAAGTAYGIPWQVLAAINEVETDYGRDLSVSSAGAEGWMQFLPAEWAQYGVDANGDGFKDPYNPAKSDLPSRSLPGNTSFAPISGAACGMPHAFTWNIGTTGSMESRADSAHGVGQRRAERMQHRRAMRVQRALRIAGRARRVAEKRGRALVEDAASRKSPSCVRQQRFVAEDRRGQIGEMRAMHASSPSAIQPRHVRTLRRDDVDERRERDVEQHVVVVGVIDDEGDLIGKEPRVDRVADGADAGRAVVRTPDGGSRSTRACRSVRPRSTPSAISACASCFARFSQSR